MECLSAGADTYIKTKTNRKKLHRKFVVWKKLLLMVFFCFSKFLASDDDKRMSMLYSLRFPWQVSQRAMAREEFPLIRWLLFSSSSSLWLIHTLEVFRSLTHLCICISVVDDPTSFNEGFHSFFLPSDIILLVRLFIEWNWDGGACEWWRLAWGWLMRK